MADKLIILTELSELRALDLRRHSELMATPRMVDLRNIYDREDALEAGFNSFEDVGR